MPDVFISYAKEDAQHARRLYLSLTEQGIDTWFDQESLLPGQNWRHAIETAIPQSRYFIALASSHSTSKKGYVQKELKLALDVLDQHPTNETYIIPVRIEECDVGDRRLKEIHYVDFFPDYEFGLSRLFKAIRHTTDGARPSKPTPTPVEANPSAEQLDAAEQFFEGVAAKREAFQRRRSEHSAETIRKSRKMRSLANDIEKRAGGVIAAYNDAAGQNKLGLQASEFPVDVFEQPAAFRILISFGGVVYWLLRFVTYPNGTLALQLVRVKGEPNANLFDNFLLTNDSINLVLQQGEQFAMSLNSAISGDVTSEVVRDIPRATREIDQLPGTAVLLLQHAIELELIRSGA